MPTYVIEIGEIRSYRMRAEADSKEAAENAAWEPLEEVDPGDIGAELWEATIDHVRARELHDWEKQE